MWCTHGERAQGVGFLTIYSALSQCGQEVEQRIVRCESLHGLSRWRDFFKDVFLGCQVGFKITVSRLHTLMSEPQGNDRQIHPGLEQMHSNGMAPMSPET